MRSKDFNAVLRCQKVLIMSLSKKDDTGYKVVKRYSEGESKY